MGVVLVAVRPVQAQQSRSRELVVVTEFAELYRFALRGGIPASTPSSSLSISRAGYANYQFALGPDGSAHVGRYNEKLEYSVDTYAPGATGSEPPVSTLTLPPGFGGLYVDARNYLYAAFWSNETGGLVRIYAPTAQGNDPPVQTIQLPADDGLIGPMVVDSVGHLYVGASNLPRVYVFANPIRKPRMISAFCPRRPMFFITSNRERRLFLGDGKITQTDGIPVLDSRDGSCPEKPLYRITPIGYNIEEVYGVAAADTFLYAAMWLTYSGPGYVFVFDADHHRQRPLAVLDYTGIEYPIAIAVGP